MRLWVIAYDIADDKRRRTLAKCLGKSLNRVQESVFEGWLHQLELNMLIAEVRELVAPEEDKLRAYPLAVRKDERYRPCGKQQPTPRCNDYWIIG
ncbi:MAG: hypothetical protein Fur0026_10360 [Sideroxydans sp.]